MYKCEVEVQPPNAFMYFVLTLALHLASDLTAASSDAWGHTLFRSTICMHIWVIWHFTQTQGVTCKNALAVYTIHGLSADISKLCNSRESTHIERRQENGVPQILGCDVVYNTVRNSR